MAIANAHTISAGTSGTTQSPTTGLDYSGGKRTLAFYGTFGSDTTITIQAAFDDGETTANFITLTDSNNGAIEITGNDVVNLDIGRCKLRFNIAVSGTDAGPINVAIS
jgi:hypothetical protein